MELSIKGRDLVSGIPKVRTISSEEVREALRDAINLIASAVVRCLEKTPPELGADLLDRGIMLTGGGAILKGIDTLIQSKAELPVHLAEAPLTAVASGTGIVVEDLAKYKQVLS